MSVFFVWIGASCTCLVLQFHRTPNGITITVRLAVRNTGDIPIWDLTSAFLEEGAYVFITGRRQSEVNDAIKEIGKNVTGNQGDVSNLEDLDHLYDTVNQEKGRIDILFAKELWTR